MENNFVRDIGQIVERGIIRIGNAVDRAATRYPIINTALEHPIQAGAIIGITGGAIVAGGVLITGGTITCGSLCPAIATAGGAIAQFGNTVKNTTTKLYHSASSFIQRGISTITKTGSSPAAQSTGIKTWQFSQETLNKAVEYVLKDPNKMHHIFGKARHKFDPLVAQLGSKENVVRAVVNKLNGVLPQSSTSFRDVPVVINGYTVYVRGEIVNGVIKIGTMYIK